jgi:hypothetical protein
VRSIDFASKLRIRLAASSTHAKPCEAYDECEDGYAPNNAIAPTGVEDGDCEDEDRIGVEEDENEGRSEKTVAGSFFYISTFYIHHSAHNRKRSYSPTPTLTILSIVTLALIDAWKLPHPFVFDLFQPASPCSQQKYPPLLYRSHVSSAHGGSGNRDNSGSEQLAAPPTGQQKLLYCTPVQMSEVGQHAWKGGSVGPQSTSRPREQVPLRRIAKPGWNRNAIMMKCLEDVNCSWEQSQMLEAPVWRGRPWRCAFYGGGVPSRLV